LSAATAGPALVTLMTNKTVAKSRRARQRLCEPLCFISAPMSKSVETVVLPFGHVFAAAPPALGSWTFAGE
jgi:hypothetical protein